MLDKWFPLMVAAERPTPTPEESCDAKATALTDRRPLVRRKRRKPSPPKGPILGGDDI